MPPDLSDVVWTEDHFKHWLDTSRDILDEVLTSDAMNEIIREAVEYYNNHNGRTLKESVEVSGGEDGSIQTPEYMNTVVDVVPNKLRIENPDIKTEFDLSHVRIFDDFWLARTQSAVTEWSAIRRIHQHHFDQFYGNEFQWDYNMGQLIWQNFPQGRRGDSSPNRLLVRYYPKYPAYGSDYNSDDENTNQFEIADSFAKRWLKRYMSALAKLEEGNLTSKAGAINVDIGGSQIRSQAEEEKKNLEDELQDKASFYPITTGG